jgi:hypothetical protein
MIAAGLGPGFKSGWLHSQNRDREVPLLCQGKMSLIQMSNLGEVRLCYRQSREVSGLCTTCTLLQVTLL